MIDLEILTQAILKKSPHLTRNDALCKARAFRSRLLHSDEGWKFSVEFVSVLYLYGDPELKVEEAERKGLAFRPRLESINQRSRRSEVRLRRRCDLQPHPEKLLADSERKPS